ncbi:hypothetical protein FA95DRAFT_1279143 [Auriscalpium vulgare]|uniref:Uncharacterized protein n=1 Tax=Auriscalpium vulgare TaxID=40419 RepID=A0ACB8RSR9_9AGAM|nr:hypothetical protein FA95DRAFT_1279143 [Auriscalpium vulgare]
MPRVHCAKAIRASPGGRLVFGWREAWYRTQESIERTWVSMQWGRWSRYQRQAPGHQQVCMSRPTVEMSVAEDGRSRRRGLPLSDLLSHHRGCGRSNAVRVVITPSVCYRPVFRCAEDAIRSSSLHHAAVCRRRRRRCTPVGHHRLRCI